MTSDRSNPPLTRPVSRRAILRSGGATFAAGVLATRLGGARSALAQPATPAASPVSTPTGFSGLVDIGGGRRLFLESRGTRRPAVILESGYPDDADVWETIALPPITQGPAVLPGVAAFTRVCAYDRPGTVLDAKHRSRSDPAPMPRTARDIVTDLHALLQNAGVPGPYVLAGHSIGGIFVRLYAATYPDEVAGLVLVDSSHEDQNERLKAILTPEQWTAFQKLNTEPPPGLDGYQLEQLDFDASFAQMKAAARAHPLTSPLVVLSHGIPYSAVIPPDLIPGFPWDKVEQVWQELQNELAALVPNARHVIAKKSGHYIQLQQPELVIDAIQQIVQEVRAS